ncbi:type II toxin-antitoxin system RelE/ParE family toxin [Nocardia sp. NBC_00508]|uniref:type II toxin-antitoxin system RelE/ParE family toxin n=1 Tax=Nocardia sp. NBC_00508 TaxID=2975992 RepID=UPI003FA53109
MLYEILAEPEVVEFLYRLDPASRAAADHRAGLLAEFGPRLGEPYSRFLGDGVRELSPPVNKRALPTGSQEDK